MTYVALTIEGQNFITNACNKPPSYITKAGYDLFHGKSVFKITDKSDKLYNIDGHLPYSYPQISGDKIWHANPKDDAGNPITTSQKLSENLIKWFNKYSKQFELDANIIAAQSFQESGYILWNYPLTSTASGVAQFIVDAVYDNIAMNSLFTNVEKNAIFKNWSGSTTDIKSFRVKYKLGARNRPILHQNISDNPEIMIKAMCYYMKKISNNCSGIASSTLFGYNRGPKFAFPSYSKSIQAGAAHEENYHQEGVTYVFRIFNLLGNPKANPNGYFGYDKEPHNLKLNEPYDSFMAEVEEGKLRLGH